jgi:hypothetical protein
MSVYLFFVQKATKKKNRRLKIGQGARQLAEKE